MKTETKAKHTPGPWVVDKFYTYGDCVRGAPHGDVGSRYAVALVHPGHTDSTLANARLIAAAPDLLSALKLCQEYLKHCLGSTSTVDPYPMMNAALAKAEDGQ